MENFQKAFSIFSEYCNIKEEEFNSIVDSWRPNHLWKKFCKWHLKSKVKYNFMVDSYQILLGDNPYIFCRQTGLKK